MESFLNDRKVVEEKMKTNRGEEKWSFERKKCLTIILMTGIQRREKTSCRCQLTQRRRKAQHERVSARFNELRRGAEASLENGQKRRGTMVASAAVQATNYKSIVTPIFSPGVLPVPLLENSVVTREKEREKEVRPFSVSPGGRRNAAIVSLLSRHCRTIKREDKADPQRSWLA